MPDAHCISAASASSILAAVPHHVQCPCKQPPLGRVALDPRLRGGDEGCRGDEGCGGNEAGWGDEPRSAAVNRREAAFCSGHRFMSRVSRSNAEAGSSGFAKGMPFARRRHPFFVFRPPEPIRPRPAPSARPQTACARRCRRGRVRSCVRGGASCRARCLFPRARRRSGERSR